MEFILLHTFKIQNNLIGLTLSFARGKKLWDEIKNAESYYSDNYNALHNGLILLNVYSYLHVFRIRKRFSLI